MSGPLNLYKSYVFRGKDPIIDRVRTIIKDEGVKYSHVANVSGVSASTLHNWFDGATQRPQFATVMAVVRSLGYDMAISPKTNGYRNNIVPMHRKAG